MESYGRQGVSLLYAAVLLSLLLGQACVATLLGITACPHLDGFQVWADKRIPTDTSGNAAAINLGSAEQAWNYCGGTSGCKAFDNKGQTYWQWDQVVDETGYCLYYYVDDCPAYDGFTVISRVSFHNTSSYQFTGTIDAALNACKNNPTCPGVLAHNNGNYYVMDRNIDSLAPAVSGNCLYLETNAAKAGYQCIPRYGYTVHSGLTPAAPDSNYFADYETLSDAVEAEARCKINPRCTAWSTAGKMVVGGLGRLDHAGDGTCTYAKQSCPPMATFTAYWGQTPVSGHGSQDTTLCLADTYTRCKNDLNCLAFDTLRKFWNVQPTSFTAMPGMCTYVKADGY